MDISPFPALSGTTITEKFDCHNCEHPTRPPKALASDPGMEGTRSYGGRGLCTPCYRTAEGLSSRRRVKPKAGSSPAMQEYAQVTLDLFMERRRQRLNAGSASRRVSA